MNSVLIDNINSIVELDDEIYHLGDFAMGNSRLIPEVRARINCRNIHLIYGNHDDAIIRNRDYRHLFSTTSHYREIRHNHIHICLFHYCQLVWHKNGAGSIQLYGHSHGSLPEPPGRQFDVGVDCHNFMPISLDFAVEYAMSKPIIAVDHHTSKTSYF